MIKLMDLINLTGINISDFKIHCAVGDDPTPLEAFFDDDFKEWQKWQKQQNFNREHIVSLINISINKWLFAGVYKVDGVKPPKNSEDPWYEYQTTLLSGQEDLIGKVVVHFEKNFRASYLTEKYASQLEIIELRDQKMSVGDFPGYNSVRLSHRNLVTIVREQLPSWRSPLSSVSGIYVITDKSDGKLYIGSASGTEGIWGRWSTYAHAKKGENVEIIKLLKDKGTDHAKNFQYSILEICDLNDSQDTVGERETHWKRVMYSRDYGLNKN